ncbi:MAG: 30S ribosomal protein S17e [Candidatus Aenigmatarchaeota archaeon]
MEMGRIRTKDIKSLSRDLYSVHADSFSQDFEQNKSAIKELGMMEGRSKRFRNRVAGYIVRLARQAAHGHHPAGERAPEAAKEEAFEEGIASEEPEQAPMSDGMKETAQQDAKAETGKSSAEEKSS